MKPTIAEVHASGEEGSHTLLVHYKGMSFVCRFTEIKISQSGGMHVKFVGIMEGYGK